MGCMGFKGLGIFKQKHKIPETFGVVDLQKNFQGRRTGTSRGHQGLTYIKIFMGFQGVRTETSRDF
jgi:hypothetical protein